MAGKDGQPGFKFCITELKIRNLRQQLLNEVCGYEYQLILHDLIKKND
jgi:hypothetical protein